MENENILYLMILIMNVIGFYLMRVDKLRAQKHQYRISERTLWTFALLGGAVGSFFGMQVYRHKTKHTLFKFGFPFLAIAQVFLFSYFF
jgi:uncharacterized membrane protein YsdA (DUF1294 family)